MCSDTDDSSATRVTTKCSDTDDSSDTGITTNSCKPWDN